MDILIKSALGGLMIAVVLTSARFLNPTIAGLLTAIPVIFVFSFFTEFYPQSSEKINLYLSGVFVSAALTAGFLGILLLLHKNFPDKLNLNLIFGFSVYLILIFTYNTTRSI